MYAAEEPKIKVYEHITDHFLWTEISCPCCDTIKVMPGVFTHMEKLELMRVRLAFPFWVNSGHRCEKHNRDVGGAIRSWHLLFATDVRPAWAKEAPGGAENDEEFDRRIKAMYEKAEELGFGGMGRYSTFTHLDIRPEKVKWVG